MASVFARWKKPPPIEQLLPRLKQWFAGVSGQRLLASQRLVVDELLAACFGYHLLQLSVDSSLELYNNSRVQKKYRCHPLATAVDARCNFEDLPFDNDSLDVVIVHHVHEFVGEPHQLLREMQRVIVPHGQVIILGFNPWSPLGLFSLFSRFFPDSIWHNHLISCRRMQDWLSLLGFATQQVHYGCHSPRMVERSSHAVITAFLKHWPLGNYYVISAVKQLATITPIKPKWSQSSSGFTGMAPVKREKKEEVA